jgi:hypothetical protein
VIYFSLISTAATPEHGNVLALLLATRWEYDTLHVGSGPTFQSTTQLPRWSPRLTQLGRLCNSSKNHRPPKGHELRSSLLHIPDQDFSATSSSYCHVPIAWHPKDFCVFLSCWTWLSIELSDVTLTQDVDPMFSSSVYMEHCKNWCCSYMDLTVCRRDEVPVVAGFRPRKRHLQETYVRTFVA